MKKWILYIFILCLWLPFSIQSQDHKTKNLYVYDSNKFNRHQIDITNIIDKALLLTLNRFGVINIDSTIMMLRRQQYVYVHDDSSYQYLTIRIRNGQKYFTEFKGQKEYFQDFGSDSCEYILIFSYKHRKYYRIKGFDTTDFEEFYQTITQENLWIYNFFFDHSKHDEIYNKPSFIDVDCYIDKYVKKKRKFKKIECGCNCSGSYSSKPIIFY